jgi:hypothetical protein
MNIQRSTSSLMWVYCRQPDARSSSLGTSREFSRKKVPWYTSCITNDCAILAQTAVSEVITCLIEMMKNNPFGNAHASPRDTCYLAYSCICFHVCHVCEYVVHMCVNMHVGYMHMSACTFASISMYVYIYIIVCVYCMCVYIYIYTIIYLHMCECVCVSSLYIWAAFKTFFRPSGNYSSLPDTLAPSLRDNSGSLLAVDG